MSDATSPIDPDVASRLAALEAKLAAQQAALEAERAQRTDIEAERDRLASERDRLAAERDQLREAYELLKQHVELARRRLVIAKAERIDTTQLELEFATQLAALTEAARKAMESEAAIVAVCVSPRRSWETVSRSAERLPCCSPMKF